MDNINIPISPGELLDKITILEIKSEQIQDKNKLENVQNELALLSKIWQEAIKDDKTIQHLKNELKSNNQNLWEIEDKIRTKESHKEFDQEFIDLARSVYFENDKRAATKKEVNNLLGSRIVEEKSYAKYE